MEISTRFVNLPADRVDDEITHALRIIGVYAQADRACLDQFSQDGASFRLTHIWEAEWLGSTVPAEQASLTDRQPFYMSRIRSGQPWIVSDLNELPAEAEAERRHGQELGIKSTAVFPLMVAGEVLGSVGVNAFRKARQWDSRFLRKFQLISQTLANAIARQRYDQRLAERLQFETLIADLAAPLINLSANHLDTTLNEALRRMGELLNVERVLLAEFNKGEGRLNPKYFWTADGYEMDEFLRTVHVDQHFRVVSRFANECKPLVVPDCEDFPPGADNEREYARKMGIKSLLFIPVALGDRERLVLGIDAIRARRHWTAELVERLNVVMELFASVLLRAESEQKLAEAQAARLEGEQQVRLREEAINSTRDGFLISDATDPDFPIVYANPGFVELTGYSADETLGLNCRFLQGANTDPATVAQICQALATGAPFQGEILNYRKDGSAFWNFLRIAPVCDETGRLTHFVGMATDVTDRRRSEEVTRQQRDALAHVSRAATLVEIGAALAHELNQPLAAILRYAQAALRFLDNETPDIERVRRILTNIIKDDRRAGEVVGRIRKQLRREKTQRQHVDINQVIEDSLALLHSDLIIKHVDVVTELDPELPPIFGDAVQLQQVIVNLVLNAADAMKQVDSEHSRIVIRTSADSATIRVSVSDSGPGIPADQLEEVFKPFHTTKEDGMGVGLAINRTIVEAHGGKLWAENGPQGGAKMTLTIPLHSSADVRQKA